MLMTVLILLLVVPALNAQDFKEKEKKQIAEVFELFFNSLAARDTASLRSMIHSPHTSKWFIHFYSGSDLQLRVSSTISLRGLFKEVSASDGNIGMCSNNFGEMNVLVHQRFAIVTTKYQCFLEGRIENKGLYVMQLLKSDEWKVDALSRYEEKQE